MDPRAVYAIVVLASLGAGLFAFWKRIVLPGRERYAADCAEKIARLRVELSQDHEDQRARLVSELEKVRADLRRMDEAAIRKQRDYDQRLENFELALKMRSRY